MLKQLPCSARNLPDEQNFVQRQSVCRSSAFIIHQQRHTEHTMSATSSNRHYNSTYLKDQLCSVVLLMILAAPINSFKTRMKLLHRTQE